MIGSRQRLVWSGVTALVIAALVDLIAWFRPPGLGLSLVAVAHLGLIVWTLGRKPLLPELSLAVGAGVFALVPSVRASEAISVLSFGIALLLGTILVYRCNGWKLRDWTLGTYLRSTVNLLESLGGPAPALGRIGRSRSGWLRATGRTIRAGIITTVVLLVFGGLLVAADPIFGDIVGSILDFNPEDVGRIFRFVLLVPFIAWLVWGIALRAAETKHPVVGITPHINGRIEARAATGALNLLFGFFLVVQFAYLFDGTTARVDLGYAEYARRGFFELVTVAALVLGLILAVDWLVQRQDRSKSIDLLHMFLILQTLVVMSSALIRMDSYTDQFGLTELRLYTTAFMLWTGVALIWAVGTVLRGNRAQFAFGALIGGLAVAAVLIVLNPDALIARTNIERTESGTTLDAEYLAGLSADAVPVLVEAAPDHPEILEWLGWKADQLQRDWAEWGVRSWSLSEHHARSLLEGY